MKVTQFQLDARAWLRTVATFNDSSELAGTGLDPFLAKPQAPTMLLGRVAEILQA